MIGPDAMKVSRLEYNQAVGESEQRELLLNLVRLRYTDTPEFLSINGISTQMNFEIGASVGGDFGKIENANSSFLSPGASVGYSETPTITFMPRRDKEFTRQLVAPVELDSVYLLTQYGWGLDRVLRLVARDLNGFKNDVSREEVATQNSGALAVFAELTARFRRLEAAQLINIGVEHRREILSAPIVESRVSPDDILKAKRAGYQWEFQKSPPSYVLTGSRAHYVLRVSPAAWNSAEFAEVARLLGLPGRKTTYEIDPGSGFFSNADGSLRVATRSVLGTMAYLSNAVSIPEIHENRGMARSLKKVDTTLSDVLNVHVSAIRDDGAYLSVPYRGFWFYIDDSDLATKQTFGLLTSLIRLTINVGGAQNVPVLTLPVSR
ncbi:hypothetical protein NBZ79_05595 [Sneathiella marina]|uniref:DUF4815 domain-containing protein n=1 Tax=Sneathiella marina TaxID=2950108 RepID=A0ABY4WB09_9PROT|nr:hypothetical protein [Sneathiella marina]USG62449.1 hypothetical protein NBZ79_05595 [Sneathiella marina]